MHVRRSQAHSLSGHGVRQATTNISGSLLAPARNDDVCSQHSQSLGRLVSDSSVASRYNGHSTALVDLRVRQTSTHSQRSHTQHSSNPFTQSHTHTRILLRHRNCHSRSWPWTTGVMYKWCIMLQLMRPKYRAFNICYGFCCMCTCSQNHYSL